MFKIEKGFIEEKDNVFILKNEQVFMKQRLEYIDALRGLAILLVVFMHVPQYGFGQSIGGYYMELATLLAVPLFFFISGLFVPLKLTPQLNNKDKEACTFHSVSYDSNRRSLCHTQSHISYGYAARQIQGWLLVYDNSV